MIIEFEIQEINDKQAVLVNQDQEQLTLNTSNLPANSKVKDKVMLAIASAKSENQGNEMAKEILNELLNTDG